MALSSPNQDLAEETRAAMERQLEQQTRDATSGVLRRPGRGKRAGQWVQSGGEFNNLTQDEVYGRLRARQGGNSGSGPGGGLRTGGLSSGGLSSGGLSSGGLSQGSGIDWLKANGPDRYSPSRLRQMERNVDITGDAGKLSKVDQVIFDKQESDKAAKAAADAKAAAVQPTAPAAPAQFDSLNTPVGQTAKPAIPPMIARPAEPAAPPVLAKPTAAPASPDPLAPASPNPYSKATQANPDPLAPASPNPYPARSFTPSPNPVLDRAKAELAKPRDLSAAANPAAFQEWRKTDPDAIANDARAQAAKTKFNDFANLTDKKRFDTAQGMQEKDYPIYTAGQMPDRSEGEKAALAQRQGQMAKSGMGKRFAVDEPAAPPVLARPPVPATASLTPPGAINPANPLAGPAPTALDEARARKAKYEATHSAEGFGPKTKEDIIFSEYAKLPAEGATPPSPSPSNGINPRLQPGYAAQQAAAAKAADREARKTVLYPHGDAPAHDPLHKGLFKFDDRSKKSPLTTPSNPLDPVKVSQNPRTRGISPLGSPPAPSVLQKPAKPTNQAVVGNVANKRRKNPLADMLKQGRNANFPSGIA